MVGLLQIVDANRSQRAKDQQHPPALTRGDKNQQAQRRQPQRHKEGGVTHWIYLVEAVKHASELLVGGLAGGLAAR